jgi:hypothetical protein
MVERSFVRRPYSLSSRSKFLKKDREGIASTIGTMMALLVFLTFITLFTNTYIPIWMKENEKTHMDDVLNQFGDLKGKVDSLVVNAQVTGKQTMPMYQSMTLGSKGIPVFATATAGYLYLKPTGSNDSGVQEMFNFTIQGSNPVYFNKNGDDFGGGCVEFYGPNRYYVQQWYTFENGALMIYQEDGMAIRALPSLSFTNSDVGLYNVQFDQVDLIGTNTSVSGQGSAGVIIDLVYHDSQTYDLCQAENDDTDNGQLNLVFTTRYNSTWIDFLNETAIDAGLTYGTDYDLTVRQTQDGYRPVYEITLTVFNVDQFTHNRSYVMIELEY